MSDASETSSTLKLESLIERHSSHSAVNGAENGVQASASWGPTGGDKRVVFEGDPPQPLTCATPGSVSNAEDLSRLSGGASSIVAPLPSLQYNPARDGNNSTLISRVQTKTAELRKYFNLPEGENLREDFVCALKKRLLLQGRLYVFEHYVCFYSNILGYVKVKVIPMESVVNIKKKRNLGFPNSVEIVWQGGKKEFFTSFISRDEAYKQMLLAWNDTSPLARLQNDAVVPAVNSPRRAKKGLIGGLTGAMQSTTAQVIESGSALTRTFKSRHLRSQTFDSSQLRMASAVTEPEPDGLSDPGDVGDGYNEENEQEGDATSVDNLSRRTTGEDRDNSDAGSEQEAETESLYCIESDVPELPSYYVTIYSADLQMSLKELINVVVSDKSDFFERFHTSRGDRGVTMSSWGKHPRMGCVRQLQFLSPLKYRIGPSEARCFQTQRYALYNNQHLVFETSQTIPEIPYGDHFSVECRWDVLAMGSGTVHLDVWVYVPFSKSTMLRKTIEKSVVDTTRDAFKDSIDMLKKVAQENRVTTEISTQTSSRTLQREQSRPQTSDAARATPSTPPPAQAITQPAAQPLPPLRPTGKNEAAASPIQLHVPTQPAGPSDWDNVKQSLSQPAHVLLLFATVWALLILLVQVLMLRRLDSLVAAAGEVVGVRMAAAMQQEILDLKSQVKQLMAMIEAGQRET